jgi:outer membrane receptor protein involved in Fe transport
MRHSLITASIVALMGGTALASPQVAFAADGAGQPQDATEPQAREEQKQTSVGDEIIVTASRREQSVTSVPYNISAVTEEGLARNGVTSISKLARSVPGVAIVDRGPREAGMNNTIVIRGISTGGAAALTPVMPQSDTVSRMSNASRFCAGRRARFTDPVRLAGRSASSSTGPIPAAFRRASTARWLTPRRAP